MVMSCCVTGCQARFVKGEGHWAQFPRKEPKRTLWKNALKRIDINTGKPYEPSDFDRVCGRHFIGGKKSNDPFHPDYVPSIVFTCPLMK